MVKYFFYAILFLVSTTTQCSKTTVDPNGLPPETQTGAGTFACKINGMVWQWKDPDYQFLDTRPKTRWSFDANTMGGQLYIGGFRYANGKTANELLNLYADSLLFFKEYNMKIGSYKYAINFNNYDAIDNYNCQQFLSTPVYDKSSNFFSSGKLVISKFDQSSKIISGTFYCTIYQTKCDTLKITEGRFDIRYQ